MSLRFLLVLILMTAALGPAPRGAAARPDADEPIDAGALTDEHVRKAIAAIVEELYARKERRHFWDPPSWTSAHGSKSQNHGYTALVVLALLYAGESYQDPRLAAAVEHLRRAKLEGTYAIALRASVWAKLPPKFVPNLEADAAWLFDGFSTSIGGWTYEQKPNSIRKDNSIRQYGALALWEAAKRGVTVEDRYWKQLERAFLELQRKDGGWNYQGDAEPSTGSMTSAGLTTLFITQDFLHADAAVRLGSARTAQQHGLAIERGLAWMDEHFSPVENPGSFRDFYYYLYGVERVALASGFKYFGRHDWYREGAAELLRRLCSWDEASRTMTVHAKVGGSGRAALVRTHHLAFALMFLSRGRVPVAINKLEITGARWNNRPRDVANLTRWITSATETDLNWQIVGIDTEPETWLDAPMLYIASDRALPWIGETGVNPERYRADARAWRDARIRGAIALDARPPAAPPSDAIRKIKRYIDLGGLVLAVNEGSSRAFADSVERLGMLMYPEYDWRPLPADHWAYTIHAQVPDGRPGLRALSNGVRELIILAPGTDLAATFQAHGRGPDAAPSRRRGRTGDDEHFTLASNLFFYASELNRPRPRLEAHLYDPGGAGPIVRTKRTMTVVHAEYAGNWNPEPLALSSFRDYLAGAHAIDLRVVRRPLASLADTGADTGNGTGPGTGPGTGTGGATPPALVIVSGTDAHEFTAAERRAITRVAQAGGVILFETAGGRGDFARAAEQLAVELFERPVRSLIRDPLVTGEGVAGAVDLRRVAYRPYAFEIFGSRESTIRLRGMRLAGQPDGRPRLLFSREDLSHGLLDQPRWGISGYAPASARALLTNIVEHAVATGADPVE